MLATKNYKIFFHILYSKQDDKWYVRIEDSNTMTVHASKTEAIEKAMQLAEALKGQQKEIVVHRTTESI